MDAFWSSYNKALGELIAGPLVDEAMKRATKKTGYDPMKGHDIEKEPHYNEVYDSELATMLNAAGLKDTSSIVTKTFNKAKKDSGIDPMAELKKTVAKNKDK